MPRTAANVVQESSDYDQFKFLDANREQSRGHIEALKKAFEEVGNLTKVQPVLVNDKYEIIDGQHRFTACKELGLPIYFTMVHGLGVREARSMNILHRNWTPNDYVRSYANAGDPNYQKYQILRDDYGFTHSVTLAYVHGRGGDGSGGGAFREFREGQLKLDNEAEIRSRLDKLAEIGEFTNMVNNRVFAIAILRLLDGENYNHARMVKKIRLHGDRLIRKYASIDDALRMLEELYNYAQPEDTRVRLY